MYALNISSEGRVLSAGIYHCEFPADIITVPSIPEGKIADYLYVDGNFVYNPLPKIKTTETPSQLDKIEAQVTYTAMMTDTLLEV